MRIEVIIDILEYFFQPHDNKSTLYSQLAEDYNNWKSLRRYFPKIKDFYFDGIVFEDFSEPKYASIEISNKDTIMLATEFFVKQGIFFANPFNKFVKKAPTNVSFFTPNSHFSGGMLNIVSTNTQYIFSPNYKDIRKTTNFTHEAEHVIENKIRANFFKNFIINETCALFIELISTDYYNNLFGFEQQNLLRQFEILYNVKMDAGDIIVRNKLLKLFNKYKNNKKRLYNRLAQKYDIDNLIAMSNFSLHDLYNYQIPYLIAVELYIIYQKDKDKALNILIKIILHATPYNIFSLLHNNGIILNQHCVKYEKELCFKLGY